MLPTGPLARGHPKGCWASQSYIVAGPAGQPKFYTSIKCYFVLISVDFLE